MNHNTLALFFLVLVVVLAAAGVGVAFWRSPYNIVQTVYYFIAQFLTRVVWRAQIPDRLPLDPRQGALIVVNHRSSVDPFFVQMAAGRVVHWMVAREYCENIAFGWFLRACEVIPVNRGGNDTAATKKAIRLIQQGGVIGMFPEGRINMTDEFMLPGRPGAILMALKARVPILPCYIEGSPYRGTPWSPFFMRANVRVLFGEPMDLSEFFGREREDGVLGDLMMRCLREIARLANRPDFQPRLAGRKWKPTDEEIAADLAEMEKRRE